MNSVLRIARPVHAQAAIGAAWCALIVVGAWLLVRRIGGYISEPMPAVGLVAFAVALAAVLACLRYVVFNRSENARLGLLASLAGWLPAAVAVSLPGSSPWALALAWLALIAGEGAGFVVPRFRARRRPSQLALPAAPIERPIDEPLPLAAEVQQEQTRSTREGVDSLVGRVRASFAAGQKTQVLHVAFCPPFAGEPETEIETLEGDDAQVASKQVYSYGMRIEIRRREASHAGEAIVGFSAVFTPAPRDSRSGGE